MLLLCPFCPTLCNPMDCSILGVPVIHCLPEFAQTHIHCVDDAIQPSHLLSPSSPPAFSLSQNRGLFQWGGQRIGVWSSIRWPKYWSFSFSISPSNEYSGLMISFKIGWFDLLAVQETLISSAINFPLSSTFTASDKFFKLYFLFSFHSKYFKIFLKCFLWLVRY